MELSTNSHGKPCAHYEGYVYNVKRSKQDGTVSWCCSKQRSTRCRGSIKSKNNEVLESSEHQCGPPDEARLEVLKAVNQAKKRARDEETSISGIYSQQLGDLHNRGYDFVTEMPAEQVTKRSLYRHRSKAQGIQREPESLNDVCLDKDVLDMSDGSSFLLKDDNSGERIIIFSGKLGKEALKSKQDFFVDGTFKSCSKQFAQIYTIHADFGSSKCETNIFPVIFALLPNKKKNTYIRLFRLLHDAVPEWKPATVTIDFESAAIYALKEVFPSVKLQGCYFHMKKCLWRKVQHLGLACEYMKNEEVKLIVRMCAALAFLPPEDIPNGWLEIHSRAPNNEQLVGFLDYFVENWMENEQIPVELWSCYRRRHRTTNSLEGWHNRINSELGRPNPRVKDLIRCLKKEAESSACALMRAQLNMTGKRRKSVYSNLDETLKKTIQKYEENHDVLTCLKTISHLQKL